MGGGFIIGKGSNMPEHTMTSGDTLRDVVREGGIEETIVTFMLDGNEHTVTSTSPEVAEAARHIKSNGYLSDPNTEVFIEYDDENLIAIGYEQTMP
jgi:hypothetical protein